MACDAGPKGIAGVLSYEINGVERPIAFILRALTPAEGNYSQLNKEALAIIFSVDEFFMYLFGKKFKLITDNRSLTKIFNQNSKLSALTAGRLLRYATFFSSFDYEIEHRSAENHANVDYLSSTRNTILKPGFEQIFSQEVADLNDQVINQILTVEIYQQSIAEETAKDNILSKIIENITNGKQENFEFYV